jgi:hypothetical protein
VFVCTVWANWLLRVPYLSVLIPHPKFQKYLGEFRTFPAPPKYIFLPFKFPRINPTGLQPCSAPISFPYSLRERDHHYHCCCCCWIPCLCLRVLMVRFGCGQPWCMTLYAAPAAPTARLLAAGLLWPALHVQALQVGPLKARFFFGPPGGLFIAASSASRSARSAFDCWLGYLPVAAPFAAEALLSTWLSPRVWKSCLLSVKFPFRSSRC